MPLIPTLERWKEEDGKFQDSFGDIGRLSQKKKRKEKRNRSFGVFKYHT
jgi:hypothetical protein